MFDQIKFCNTSKLIWVLAAIFLLASAERANADYLYTYTGNPFTYAGNTVTDLQAYNTANFISFTFTSAQPIVGNEAVNPIVSSWTFSDGTQMVGATDALQIASFQFTVTPSSSQQSVFEYWTIALNYYMPHASYPNFINTTNALNSYSQPLVYDWGQNQLGNYGGNWSTPGIWTMTAINAPVTAVPEPETYAMLLAGLGLLGFMARRRKDYNV